MKNCYSCKHKHIEDDYDFIYCDLIIPNEVFELDCENAECPYWEGEE